MNTTQPSEEQEKEPFQEAKKTPRQANIGITPETMERLKVYCNANNISQRDFVTLSLEYFERTGYPIKHEEINALQIDYTPAEKVAMSMESVSSTIGEAATAMLENNTLLAQQQSAMKTLCSLAEQLQSFQMATPTELLKAGEEKARAIADAEKAIERETRADARAQRAEERENLAVKNLNEALAVLNSTKKRLAAALKELERVKQEQRTFGKIEVKTAF